MSCGTWAGVDKFDGGGRGFGGLAAIIFQFRQQATSHTRISLPSGFGFGYTSIGEEFFSVGDGHGVFCFLPITSLAATSLAGMVSTGADNEHNPPKIDLDFRCLGLDTSYNISIKFSLGSTVWFWVFSLCPVSGGVGSFYSFCNCIISVLSSIVAWGIFFVLLFGGLNRGLGVFSGKYDMTPGILVQKFDFSLHYFLLCYTPTVANYGGKV